MPRARVRGALRGGVGVSGNPRSRRGVRLLPVPQVPTDAFVAARRGPQPHNCYARSRNASSRAKTERGRAEARQGGGETARRAAVRENARRRPRAASSCPATPTPPPGGARPRRVHRKRERKPVHPRAGRRTPPPHRRRRRAGTMAALLARGGEGVPSAYGAVLDRKFGAAAFVSLRVRRRRLRVRQGSRRDRRDAARRVRQRRQRRQPLNSKPWERLVD